MSVWPVTIRAWSLSSPPPSWRWPMSGTDGLLLDQRPQLALQEVAAEQGAGGGVRALLALEDDPARVADGQQRAGDRREVDQAVVVSRLGEPARDLPGAAADPDGPVGVRLQVLLGVVDGERVLELDVRDPVRVPLDHAERVDAGDGQLTGVQREAGVGALEQGVERAVAAQRREEVDVQRQPDAVLQC